MKKINIAILTVFVLSLGILTSCKKKKDDTTTPTNNSTAKPNDQQGSSEADEAIKDVNDFINNKVGGGSNHRIGTYALPCGVVSVDSTLISAGKYSYKMSYGNQTTCTGGYKKKSGDITFALSNGTAFNTAGAVFTITFSNYKVESIATGATVTLNGTIVVTNTTGHYIWEAVTASQTITHKVRGTFTVTYSDGTVRSRSYYQLRTWASINSWQGLTLTIAGDTTVGTLTGVSEIGKTYDGNYDYTTQITTNFVWANCGTTYAGPYVLKFAKARLNVTIPLITPTYIDVEGGYHYDYTNTTATPTLTNDCSTNAYKITTVIATSTTSQYQLY
jgi:hypothetical protein